MRKPVLILVMLFYTAIMVAGISQTLEDADSLTVGSRFKLSVKADFAINRVVIPDSLSGFEVISNQRITKNADLPYVELSIVPLQTGALSFPPLVVEPVVPAGQTFSTDRFRINVLEVRTREDETLRDIKPPKRYPWQKAWWIYIAALLMAIAAGIWQLSSYLASRKKPVRVIDVPKTKPVERVLEPWELALQRLEQVLSLNLAEQGLITELHFRLAQILRAYLEQVYRFPALEMTTNETLRSLHRIQVSRFQEIRAFLQACDIIKFAKGSTNSQDLDKRIDWLREYFLAQDPLKSRISISKEGDDSVSSG